MSINGCRGFPLGEELCLVCLYHSGSEALEPTVAEGFSQLPYKALLALERSLPLGLGEIIFRELLKRGRSDSLDGKRILSLQNLFLPLNQQSFRNFK